MENFKLEESTRALKKLAMQYENRLRRLGIDINYLPDEIKTMLDEYGNIQMATGLHELDELYLREYHLIKKKEKVDNKLAASKVRTDLEKLKREIEQEMKECALLERFTNQKVESEEESQMYISLLESKIQNLQLKEEQVKLPENFNIDDLIEKVEILKGNKGEEKKK